MTENTGKLTTDKEEFALQALFGRQIPPVADAGFSRAVLGRLRRRIWKRRVILLAATVAGLVIALPAASQLLFALSDQLVTLVGRAEQSEALGQFQVFLNLLPLRETVERTSEGLRNFSAQIDAALWFRQYRMLVLAGLLAAVSLVTTRLLDN